MEELDQSLRPVVHISQSPFPYGEYEYVIIIKAAELYADKM